jgi:hypothetical protein
MLATVAVLRTPTVASVVLTAPVTHQPLPTPVQVVAEAEAHLLPVDLEVRD